MTKFLREVERRAGVQFVALRRTGGGHWQAYLPGLGRPVTLPATPSCHHAARNAVAHIRRAMKNALL